MFSWLSNTIVAPLLLALCIILLLVTASMTIAIYGIVIPVVHWHIVSGYKYELQEAKEDADKAKQQVNYVTSAYNAATAKAKVEGDKAKAASDAKVAEAQKALADIQAQNNITNAQLQRILDNAKREDTRTLGPTVQSYLDGVRFNSTRHSDGGSPSH